MREYISFEKTILSRSFAATFSFIETHLIKEGILAATSGAVGYIIAPFENHHPLFQSLYISFGTAIITILSILFWNISVSPFKMWKEQKLEIDHLKTIQRDNIREQRKPLNIDTGTGKFFEEVLPTSGSFAIRTVSIAVTNGNTFFLSNCKVTMMLLHSTGGERYYTIAEQFSLHPGDTKYIKVAEYPESVGNIERNEDIKLCIPRHGLGTVEDWIPHENKYPLTFNASCAQVAESTTVAILSVNKDGRLILKTH